MCQPFVCLRQVSLGIRRAASLHLGAGNNRQLLQISLMPPAVLHVRDKSYCVGAVEVLNGT